MKFFSTLAVVSAAVGSAVAQRPSNTSMCDYYTTALFKNNTAANQYKLLTALVNTVVIGNYSSSAKNPVTGILNPGTYNGTQVNLLPYFNGALLSTNQGGSSGVSVSFLDGGGAAPLKMGMPANDTTSNQYMLLTHLYEFFGVLLNCSQVGTSGFPAYGGDPSMYSVHKFMDLNAIQIGYFITQVGEAATSFGVTTDDATAVGGALGKLFNYRCSPNTTVVPSAGPQMQSICVNPSCPLDPMATCSAYPNGGSSTMPGNATMGMGSAMGSGSASSPASMPTSSSGSSGSSGASGSSAPASSSSARPNSGADKTGISAGALAVAGVIAAFAL